MSVGAPSKPIAVMESGRRIHRSRESIEKRKKAEAELLTGTPMTESREVKADPVAHKAWQRVRKLLAAIGKNDALYEKAINRYCIITSESERLRERLERIYETADGLEDTGEAMKIWKDAAGLERQLSQKRGELLKIEQEHCMTLAAALRAVPKETKDEEEADPMAELLRMRG